MRPITFDRFVRGLILLAAAVVGCLAFSWLSSVLIPFLVAGVLAYLLNPVCNFLQTTCRLRLRVVCVVLTLVLFFGVITGLLLLCVPPLYDECKHLSVIVAHYVERGAQNNTIPEAVRDFFELNFRSTDVSGYVASGDFMAVVKSALPRVWDLVRSTASIILSLAASLIGLLYLFFLLLDYERYAKGWTSLVPPRHRGFVRRLIDDVAYYMCGYFRGQLFIALSNCVMFTIGFLLVGFPMPIALGCFIGIISFVPYLQVAGIIPAALLALLRAAETGQNFWVLLGSVVLVYVVVQIIQDIVVTPRIMGRIMGLSPAIILLALSVGAFVGGIGGLIVALPLTTLGLTYYKRYVVRDGVGETRNSEL